MANIGNCDLELDKNSKERRKSHENKNVLYDEYQTYSASQMVSVPDTEDVSLTFYLILELINKKN